MRVKKVIDWSKSGQDKALVFTGRDMLVSASAGSGKTTVMVEKIKRFIKGDEHGCGKLSELVVVTFTRASASDMKGKLEEELHELIRDALAAGNTAEAERFRGEIRSLSSSYIGTIDGICGEIFKRYFEDIGRSPSYVMLDDNESAALRSEAENNVISKLLEVKDSDLLTLSEYYTTSRGDNDLYDIINLMMNFLDVQENPEQIIAEAARIAEEPLDGAIYFNYLKDFFLKKLRYLYGRREVVSAEFNTLTKKHLGDKPNKFNEFIGLLGDILAADNCRSFYDALQNYSAVKDKVGKIKKGNTWTDPIELASFERIKAYYNASKRLLNTMSELFGDYDKNAELAKPIAPTFGSLVKVVNLVREEYARLKEEQGRVDFVDIERYALAILSNPERSSEFKKNIKYVFFDEYQDTNRLQEAIISKISDNNLFMVGDVKQSIYGFRLSEPDIFLKRYEEFTNEDKENANKAAAVVGQKSVPLNMNFRSRDEILQFIDRIFSKIMTAEFGGIDYERDACFGAAGASYAGLGGEEPAVEVAVYTRGAESSRDSAAGDDNGEERANVAPTFPDFYDIRTAPLSNNASSKQADYVCAKINAIVNNDKIRIPDPDTKEQRRLRYSDIAVLVRVRDSAEPLKEAFKRNNIPYVSSKNDNFYKGDIDALTAVVKIIDNPCDDYALAAAMLSHVGGFDERELAIIARDGTGDYFYEKTMSYAGEYRDKIDGFYDRIERYRKRAHVVDVSELLSYIANDTGYISALLTDGAYERLETFNMFVKYIRDKEAGKDVARFLKFTESTLELNMAAGGDNSVRIMTIHNSKGLEFPVVFLFDAGRSFSDRHKYKTILADNELGVGLKVRDVEAKSITAPLSRIAIEFKKGYENACEECRLLYVALTRARYYLYIVGEVGKMPTYADDAACDYDYLFLHEFKSYISWILYAESKYDAAGYIKINPRPDDIEGCVSVARGNTPLPSIGSGMPAYDDSAPDIIAFEYPVYANIANAEICNKYTVTALNRREEADIDDEVSGSYVPSLGSENREKGIAYHKIMELIDFGDRTPEGINRQLDDMAADGVDIGEVDRNVIIKALSHDIFALAARSKTLREQEFIFYVPACEVFNDKPQADDKILIQGVMDLIILSEEGNVLVDYKVSGGSSEELRARYAEQIKLYGLAFERITGKRLARKLVFVLNRGEIIEY